MNTLNIYGKAIQHIYTVQMSVILKSGELKLLPNKYK